MFPKPDRCDCIPPVSRFMCMPRQNIRLRSSPALDSIQNLRKDACLSEVLSVPVLCETVDFL